MNYCILLAGGIGSRIKKYNIPKQFLNFNNDLLIFLSLKKIIETSIFSNIVIPCNEKYIHFLKQKLIESNINKNIYVISGGKNRNDSIKKSYIFLKNNFNMDDNDTIMIHESSRPFITSELIVDCINEININKNCFVTAGFNVVDTIHITNDNFFDINIPKKSNCFYGQTPQGSSFRIFEKIFLWDYDELFFENADICNLATTQGLKIKISKGSYSNKKITYDDDLN